jgi:DNA polymerase III gamma/tau subunit
VIFIFGTTSVDKMPDTLRSRCAELQFPLPTETNVYKKMEYICKVKDFYYTPDALYTIIQATGRHYRDAEIKLGQASRFGDINEENVNKVVTICNKEIAYMLVTLQYDLTKTFKAVEYLTGRMNIHAIYEGILRLLNDTLKYVQGFTFESTSYTETLKILAKQYSSIAYEVIDYILTKHRLNDLTVFQSDLLILHYKFLQNHFVPKETTANKTAPSVEQKSQQVVNIDYVNSQPPWEREEIIRQGKYNKIKEKEDSKISENLSKTWGPEIIENAVAKKTVLRKPITKEAFQATFKEL